MSLSTLSRLHRSGIALSLASSPRNTPPTNPTIHPYVLTPLPRFPPQGFVVDLSQLRHPEMAYLGAVDADPQTGSLLATGSRTVGVVAVAERCA
jgi:hypothetical protein